MLGVFASFGVSWALSRTILRGAARNRPTILVTPMAHALAGLMRVAPRFTLWLNGFSFRLLLRRLAATTPSIERS